MFDQPAMRRIPVRVYTDDAFITGMVTTPHARLSDAVNSVEDHLRLSRVLAVRYAAPAARQPGREAIVLKSSVCFLTDRPSAGYQPARGPMAVERERLAVALYGGPFTLTGQIHIPPGGDLTARILSVQLPFIPLTEVTIGGASLPELREDAVLVNRHRIAFVIRLDGQP